MVESDPLLMQMFGLEFLWQRDGFRGFPLPSEEKATDGSDRRVNRMFLSVLPSMLPCRRACEPEEAQNYPAGATQ